MTANASGDELVDATDVGEDLAALVTRPAAGTLGDGPWASSLWVTVPGRVLSKSNYRNARGASWKDVSGYEDLVHQVVRAARPADWPRPDPGPGPRARVAVLLAARTGLDAGNLSKSVLDACEGALYVSDAQVGSLTDLVVPARADLGLFAAFAALAADVDAAGLLAVQAELLLRTTTLIAAAAEQ